MANNRMYLTCACGETKFLAKRMGDEYYTAHHIAGATSYVESLDDWLDDHCWCGETQEHFIITYES